MTVTVFVGASVDGFIARLNHDLDWLPEGGGEPHGYEEFMATVDALVIGRKTFEKVVTFNPWPYGSKRVVVLSDQPLDLSKAVGGVVEQRSGSPAEIVAQLAASAGTSLIETSRSVLPPWGTPNQEVPLHFWQPQRQRCLGKRCLGNSDQRLEGQRQGLY